MSTIYAKELKQPGVQEARDTGNATLVARRHHLSSSMGRRWVREATQAAPPSTEVMTVGDENERLQRLRGEKDLQIAVLPDLLRKKGIRP